jgi:phosphohistidine phosphatase
MANMHQLILLRHAKAAATAAAVSDHDRPLTDAGAAAAANIGRAMRAAGLAPDVVLVSPSVRTQQTFAALEAAGVWAEWPNVEPLPALYMASPQQMRDILRGLPETVRSAMIIGHNPGLHELARKLAGTAAQHPQHVRLAESYPTATLTEFLIATPWRKIGVNAASLQRFLAAKDLA